MKKRIKRKNGKRKNVKMQLIKNYEKGSREREYDDSDCVKKKGKVKENG